MKENIVIPLSIVVIAVLAFIGIYYVGSKQVKNPANESQSGQQNDVSGNTTSSDSNNTSMQDAKTKGEEFLKENKTRPGVITTASGLQYEILKEGTGPKPTKNQTVKVHYEGTLIDGTVFDSSYQRGEPIEFPVTGVIPGWVEALQLMPVGSKWKLYIPSDLAYGPYGAGGAIGPNETLIFTVELLAVK
jgi:FKBP-type peptidyl-prolyl cis-trans isomerase FklB